MVMHSKGQLMREEAEFEVIGGQLDLTHFPKDTYSER